MLVLLAISSLAALLVPPPEQPSPPPGETTTTAPRSAGREQGDLVRATIDASRTRPQTVRIRLGDQLVLRVSSARPDEVEIPRLGALEDVDPDAPASLDLRPTAPGRYPVRLVERRRTIGRILVRPRG